MKVSIKKLTPNAKIPKKMTPHSAGLDVYSANTEDIIIEPNKLALVSCGFAIALPIGFEAQIRPRSGLALKHQIGVLNSPGTIDSDYRGEVKVILFNFGDENFVVTPNSRIAQMVISKHESVDFTEVETLDETARGAGGFGHTSH